MDQIKDCAVAVSGWEKQQHFAFVTHTHKQRERETRSPSFFSTLRTERTTAAAKSRKKTTKARKPQGKGLRGIDPGDTWGGSEYNGPIMKGAPFS